MDPEPSIYLNECTNISVFSAQYLTPYPHSLICCTKFLRPLIYFSPLCAARNLKTTTDLKVRGQIASGKSKLTNSRNTLEQEFKA